MGKKTVTSVADAFVSGLDKQIEEEEARKKKKGPDTTAFDKAVLEQIGKDNLKKAVEKLSFASLYRFLKEAGFMGDKARLADLLDSMGVRTKGEVPEHFKKKCDCGNVLVREVDDNKRPLWLCYKCGKYYTLSKGRLMYEDVFNAEELEDILSQKKGKSKP